MNTYDPAKSIVYVHMARESDPYATPVTSTRTCNRLPAGYANKSPRTHVGGCTRLRHEGHGRSPGISPFTDVRATARVGQGDDSLRDPSHQESP